MSNERDKERMDTLVSETYREHSVERVPEHLNDKILQMAAKDGNASKIARSLLDNWTRPLALAATVVLSFAILLEFTQVSDTNSPSSPATDSVREEFKPKDTGALDDARNQARLREGPNRDEDLNAVLEDKVEQETRQNAANFVAPEPAARTDAPARSIEDAARASNPQILEKVEADSALQSEEAPLPAAARVLGNAKRDSADRVEQVASDDLQQSAPAARETAASSGITSFSMAIENKESDSAAGCDDSQRGTADDWWNCIEALRSSGAYEQADQEYQQYILQFPVE